jgi:hypothetical protein
VFQGQTENTQMISRRVVLAVWHTSHAVLLYFITLRIAAPAVGTRTATGGYMYSGFAQQSVERRKIGSPPSQPYDEGQTRNGVLEKALPGSIASI